MQAYVERTLDLHAKIEQASPENRQLVEESLEAKAKEEPGNTTCARCIYIVISLIF